MSSYQIDYTVHLLYKRLSKRFDIETLERHWKHAVKAAKKRAARNRS